MPTKALHACETPGCAALVTRRRCPEHQREDDRRRAHPHLQMRRWYYSLRWKRLRERIIRDAAHICAACRRVCLDLDVDHIVPHRGDATLFWSPDNLQPLCPGCHATKTNRDQTRRW